MTKFFTLDAATLPDELYREDCPVLEWLDQAREIDPATIAPGSLGTAAPLAQLPRWIQAERICGVSLYVALNLVPPLVVFLTLVRFAATGTVSATADTLLVGVALYLGILLGSWKTIYWLGKRRCPTWGGGGRSVRYDAGSGKSDSVRKHQYGFAERYCIVPMGS